jgi:tricarballylate dehydrogenase
MTKYKYDIVVVGHGMAGLAASVRAAELGRSVAMLEKAPKDERGGQTGYSESFRVPSTATDLSQYGYEFAIPDYTVENFYDDIMARTDGKADPDIARTLVENAGPTIEWLTEHGVEWNMEPLAVGYTVARTWFDNDQLVDRLAKEVKDLGGDIYYETTARELAQDDHSAVVGLEAALEDERVRFDCDTVVLACGGYESSPQKRVQYYGPGYDDMKVRGSGYNTGEAIDIAQDIDANVVGQWSGAHMALIDANSPDVGGGANRIDGYQYGVMINVNGKRFVDEGEDARAHTYAKFGQLIFEEPKHLAYIILDSETQDLARATGPSEPTIADSIDELLAQLQTNERRAHKTIEAFNAACVPGEFDPEVLDGNHTKGIEPQKSNWAIPIDEPPFYAYPVTGGITFSFGGIETTTAAQVLDSRGRVIPGLYAAGNSTGKLFYNNYPGGTGLTNAAVYGKIAAERAEEYLD